MKAPGSTTIREVARLAGVAVSTVSRVLNKSGYYDEETAQVVHKAVEQLGYRPNVHWRRLKRNSPETVAFLLGNRESMNSQHVSLLMACQKTLFEAGYDLAFLSFSYRQQERSGSLSLPRLLEQSGSVDGIILAGIHHANLLEALAAMDIPFVMLGNGFIGESHWLERDSIVYDDISGAFEAVQYLIRLGHRRIAFIGDRRLPWFERRYQGYLRALKDAGLPPQTLMDALQGSNVEFGQLAASKFLRQRNKPTAIFAGNDTIAGGVWKELTAHRIAIPRDISLIGFGERKEFQVLEPSLTTVSIFPEKLGGELAKMLIGKLRKKDELTLSRVFSCKVIEKNSCAPPVSQVRKVTR